MENKKILKNITLGLICLSVLVLIGINIHQHQQIKKARQAKGSWN